MTDIVNNPVTSTGKKNRKKILEWVLREGAVGQSIQTIQSDGFTI